MCTHCFSGTGYGQHALLETHITVVPTTSSRPPHLFRGAKVVPFTYRHPLVPEDVIRRRDVEVEIRQRKLQEVVRRRPLVLRIPGLDYHFLFLLAVHAVLGHRFQKVNRLLDACVELFEGGFVVGHGDAFDPGDADDGAFACVADSLDLVW